MAGGTEYPKYAPVGQYRPFHISAAQTTVAGVGRASTQAVGATVTAGSSVTISNINTIGLTVGEKLFLWQTSPSNQIEIVNIAAVPITNATTGQVTLSSVVNSYGSSCHLTTRCATSVGTFSVNQPGTNVTVTLYNGDPNAVAAFGANLPTGYGSAVAVIIPNQSQPATYHWLVEYGLFYTAVVGGGGTIGDYTLGYISALPL